MQKKAVLEKAIEIIGQERTCLTVQSLSSPLLGYWKVCLCGHISICHLCRLCHTCQYLQAWDVGYAEAGYCR